MLANNITNDQRANVTRSLDNMAEKMLSNNNLALHTTENHQVNIVQPSRRGGMDSQAPW